MGTRNKMYGYSVHTAPLISFMLLMNQESSINKNNNNNNNKNNNNKNKNKNTNNNMNQVVNQVNNIKRKVDQECRKVRNELSVVRRIARPMRSMALSQHEIAHLLAVVHPELARGMQPRSLGFSGIHTQPIEVRGSFEVYTGTQGFGFIALHPRFF